MHIDGGLRRAARTGGTLAGGPSGRTITIDGGPSGGTGTSEAPRTVHLAEILASTRAGVFA
jgi:hypothetical protein